jgi:Rieske Fe-S protein
MNRRDFIKISALTGAVIVVSPSAINQRLFAHDGRVYEAFEKVLLVDADGKPLKASSLTPDIPYIFNYPHVGTPNFLISTSDKMMQNVELKTGDGEVYVWNEGSGKTKNIVAYSAICSHALTHPTKDESFITLVSKGVSTAACDTSKNGAIVCSSHLSAFDHAGGCKVVGGPADQPLASVVLEYDEKADTLHAVGVLGGTKYADFFGAFKTEMDTLYGSKRKAKKPSEGSATVTTLAAFTKEIIQY